MKAIVQILFFVCALSSTSFAAVEIATPAPQTQVQSTEAADQARQTASQAPKLERFSGNSFRCFHDNETNYREATQQEPSAEQRDQWVELCAQNSEL